MTYGLGTSLFIENGPAVVAEMARARRSPTRIWRKLDAERRLNLVEHALAPRGRPSITA